MSIARYTATQNAAASPRDIEIRALRYVNGLLSGAQDALARATALNKTAQLWYILLNDLASDGNALPDDLKAKLISLGLWAQREVAARLQDDQSLAPLIALHRDLIAGLEGQVARPVAEVVPFHVGAA